MKPPLASFLCARPGRPALVLLAVIALLGLAAGPAVAQAPLSTLTSPTPGTDGAFGGSVAGVPDVDGDGQGDLLVGAPGENGTFFSAGGRAYLVSGATGALLHTLEPPDPESGGFFGYRVAGVPDADGDGRGDLLVGAYAEDSGAYSAGGRAYLFSGATGALLHTLTSPNPETDGYFGSVAGVPDVDGDGRGDLLVGAWRESGGAFEAGRAYLFSGATGALLHTLTSPNANYRGYFGVFVAGVADADGDGRGDLLIGAGRETVGGSSLAGRAYLFSGATGALLHTLESPNPQSNVALFGSVADVPDADGDGRGDLLVGAPEENIGISHVGRVYLFSGATGTLLHTLEPPGLSSGGEGFGYDVAGVSDVDGDGRGDLLVGAADADVGGVAYAGQAYLFSGATGALLHTLESPDLEPLFGAGESFGSSVAGVADADGDGRGDLLVGAYRANAGAYGAGRAYLFSGTTAYDLTATVNATTVQQGGSVEFSYTVTNDSNDPVSGDVFYVIERQDDGSTVAQGVVASGTLRAGRSFSGSYTQNVPPSAPTGFYAYRLLVGQFPNTVLDSEVFTIGVITGSGRATDGVETWSVTDATPWEVEGTVVAPLAVAAEGTVLSVYPNPSYGRTAIRFYAEEAMPVRLAVYDVMGREVAVLADGTVGAGAHEVAFERPDLTSGVYVVRLKTGSTVRTERLTLVR